MPNTAHVSSSRDFVFFKHSLLASRQYVSQPQLASLTEHPDSLISVHQRESGAKGGHARVRGVVREKRSLAGALKASGQPAAVWKGQRAPDLCSNCHRSLLRAMPLVRLIQTTSWLDPRVRAELEREARERGLSLSEVVALACRDWVRYEIHRQQTSLFEEKQRQIVREEIRSLRDSLVHFELKTAVASEHTRIMTTDVYQRTLKAAGVSQERFYELLDESDEMAYNNILNRSPKFTEKLAQWEAAKAATRKEAKPN
jgi:hypothetical protein